jgi:PhzF family phenazine biosynthesis protein
MPSLFHVNAFSDQAFNGNPAAVCLLDSIKPDSWLQNVAAQMNLSETAFVTTIDNGYSLRWFTPLKEVDMCGHATLASAHVLWQQGIIDKKETIFFQTLSGMLSATLQDDQIELDFPRLALTPIDPPEQLIKLLGITPIFSAMFGEKHLFVIEDQQQLVQLNPDFSALASIAGRGISITCKSNDSQYDFVSRYFAPWVGINEDPANGSSHCALTPYWAGRLGKQELTAYQASKRGGELKLRLASERVKISGQAITVLKAELLV